MNHKVMLGVMIVLCFSHVRSIDCKKTTKPIDDCFTYCRIQYKGNKNFYNSTSELCEGTPLCTADEEYDISKNQCIPIGSSIEDELGNITINNTNPDKDDNELKPPQVKCVNGFYPANSSLCVCYPGWISEENNSTSETEILKCSKATDYNSTNKDPNSAVEQSTSDISLILSIAIPTIIGLILIIVIIVCIKKHCMRPRVDLSNKERPIVIHLSNDATERMKMNNNNDGISNLNQEGYCTPVKKNHNDDDDEMKQHAKSNKNTSRPFALNHSLSFDNKRQFVYNTPDVKKQRRRTNLKCSIGKTRSYTPDKRECFITKPSKVHYNTPIKPVYRYEDDYINNNNYTTPHKTREEPINANYRYTNMKPTYSQNKPDDYPMTYNQFLSNPNYPKSIDNDEEYSNESQC